MPGSSGPHSSQSLSSNNSLANQSLGLERAFLGREVLSDFGKQLQEDCPLVRTMAARIALLINDDAVLNETQVQFVKESILYFTSISADGFDGDALIALTGYINSCSHNQSDDSRDKLFESPRLSLGDADVLFSLHRMLDQLRPALNRSISYTEPQRNFVISTLRDMAEVSSGGSRKTDSEVIGRSEKSDYEQADYQETDGRDRSDRSQRAAERERIKYLKVIGLASLINQFKKPSVEGHAT